MIDTGENIGGSDIDNQALSGDVWVTSGGELDGGVRITSDVNSTEDVMRGDSPIGVRIPNS